MSSRNPPLEVRDVRKVLRNLGFEKVKGEGPGSHEVWKKYSPHLLRVDVDPPKAPFSHDLIKSMAAQAGVTRGQFYKAQDKKQAAKILKKAGASAR